MAQGDTDETVALGTLTSRSETAAERVQSLEDGNGHGRSHGHEEEDTGPDLPPIDRGSAAWRMLFSAFIFESLLWGESKSLACTMSVFDACSALLYRC